MGLTKHLPKLFIKFSDISIDPKTYLKRIYTVAAEQGVKWLETGGESENKTREIIR